MTDYDLKQFFMNTLVDSTIIDLDARVLESKIGYEQADNNKGVIEILRLAAITSFVELIGKQRVDIWFRPNKNEMEILRINANKSFVCWRGFLDALSESKCNPTLEDMLMFVAIGLISAKDNEIRDELRRKSRRDWLDNIVLTLDDLPWVEQVRAYISVAILFVVRQENCDDIKQGNDVLIKLAHLQKEIEPNWIEESLNPKRNASTLIGFYFLAEAIILITKFLSDGIVEINGKEVSDFSPELRRLIVKSEEFLLVVNDNEQILWLQTAACIIAFIRSSSIWVQAKGISERVDNLLTELVRSNRDQQVFSLLPSQQEALRKSLLDPSKMAIVLQMPTSTGKTLLAEFSIVQTLDSFRGSSRVVYIVPTRALATQVRRTLTEDLRPLGINVAVAGSAFEEDPYELQLLEETDGVIVTTPEKLDLLLRAHSEWAKTLRLVVVDEAHLIHDGERGARLELLLVNIRREQPDARLLLLTPFMENAQEIAEWLSRERSTSISVNWRPTKVLLGLATISGKNTDRYLSINWKDPFNSVNTPKPLKKPTNVPSKSLKTNTDRILFLADELSPLGSVLAMYSASPAEAEKAAIKQADKRKLIENVDLTPQLRVALAIARQEFGSNSKLAYCLERGVAFHHSSLSPITRYLIEDQVRDKKINFIAATSTLAQGMNFPVASILVHSVHKPYGGGNFSSAEFWNMAGRAGRVGLAERGLVVFADPDHQRFVDSYGESLSQTLQSAMLTVLELLEPDEDIKDQYRDYPVIRPFIQYLAHVAASNSIQYAIRNLEALIEQSLLNQQIHSNFQANKLKDIARGYLQQLLSKSSPLLKIADVTGLGTFSFEELYAKLRSDDILKSGPSAVLSHGQEGLHALIDALKWLPELNLAIGFGEGEMNVNAVAETVQQWIDGVPVHTIAEKFPGDDEVSKVRKASSYLNGTISQTLSWGAHAFTRGWLATPSGSGKQIPSDLLLPSLIQYGVKTPEAAVVSLLGVPRSFAEAAGDEYRDTFGGISIETVSNLRSFVEKADNRVWSNIITRSSVKGLSGDDFCYVFRKMQGLEV